MKKQILKGNSFSELIQSFSWLLNVRKIFHRVHFFLLYLRLLLKLSILEAIKKDFVFPTIV